jgi:8-oxo-dGTP diphosphatase
MTERKTVAKIAIFDRDGKILVLRRSDTHPTMANRSDMPGGLVDPGETEREAVVREVKEETGINLALDDCSVFYTNTSVYPPEDISFSRLFYLAKFDITPEVTISWEHKSYEWCTIDDLLARDDFLFFYREGIEYGLKNNLFTI